MRAFKPPRLKKGDVIGLVSPASTPTPREKIEGSVRYLEGLGYRVKLGAHVSKAWGYLAGTDEERAEDFNDMIRDPRVKAIFALRGGYGTPRILDRIQYGALSKQPKIISGFSDITALQLAIYKKCGLVTFSGPMPAVEFWKDPDSYTEEQFWRLVTSKTPVGALENPLPERYDLHREGKASGVLLGGNLALVVSTIGTGFMPSLRRAVLVLEEVGEYPYRVDRMFAQLRNAGLLKDLAAMLLGQFTECGAKDPAQPHLNIEYLLKEYAHFVEGPVLGNVLYGHVPKKLTVPLGLRATVDTKKRRIEVRESAVS
ncbi:MAG TPA: LD-carboxypeptidase [Verrucomicrobiae bacterium]